MEIDPEYLRRETWGLKEAACLLAGMNPADVMAQLAIDGIETSRAGHVYANLKDAVDSVALHSFPSRTRNIEHTRVRPWDAIQWAKARGDPIPEFLNGVPEPRPEPKPAERPLTATEPHVSDKLAKLIQAARKYWGNADRDDRSTHPNNADVAAWLVARGFSRGLAAKAATIIRPDWAGTGRKPEE